MSAASLPACLLILLVGAVPVAFGAEARVWFQNNTTSDRARIGPVRLRMLQAKVLAYSM